MHEFGRDYQPPFDNVKRRLQNFAHCPARRDGQPPVGRDELAILLSCKPIALHQLRAPVVLPENTTGTRFLGPRR